ncbi:hypothetical protein Pyrfu_1166 [Pyrolobus fumarii 1A]|uniref:Uncharacterized protein n=1 Tax=Pyrolobus fumarii (strain DSM 11204 / 1A) TaxID=694429 RepID=G0EFK5_PYRF1|nr:hypothetical protein [Pyrolobus fumarii]AEM39029.1 hypothetical protein Pyrfu_1166 [Pyrolobus fumarii 1A]
MREHRPAAQRKDAALQVATRVDRERRPAGVKELEKSLEEVSENVEL